LVTGCDRRRALQNIQAADELLDGAVVREIEVTL